MNKIHFALIFTLFTILIANILGTQDAFADIKTYDGPSNGVWEDPMNWMPDGVPNENDDVVINGPTLVNIKSDVTIGPLGSVTTSNNADLRIAQSGKTLTIQGTFTITDGASDLIAREGTILIDCAGIVSLGQGQLTAQGTGTGGIIVNHGTVTGTLTGTPPPGEDPSSNDFNIVVQSGGLVQNGGTFPSAILVFDGGTFETIPSMCNTDADGDGFDPNVDDCNDDDAKINPDAEEIADGIDNNCNGLVDEDTKKSCEGIKKGNENGKGKKKGHVKAKENNNCT